MISVMSTNRHWHLYITPLIFLIKFKDKFNHFYLSNYYFIFRMNALGSFGKLDLDFKKLRILNFCIF